MVSHIQYVFQGSDLFENIADIEIYDEIASADKYAGLCYQRLIQAYPAASIAVFDREQVWDAPLETAVDDITDSEDVIAVKNLCEDVYKTSEWSVRKSSFDLSQAAKQLHLPIPVVRWLCKETRLRASHDAGTWVIPAKGLPDSKDNLLCSCLEPDKAGDVCYCDYEDVPAIDGRILPTARILVFASGGFGIPLFNSDNSSVSIRLADNVVELIFEHFADKVPWTVGRWAYDAYVQALINQAQQYPDVQATSAECQSNGRCYTESVNFIFSYPLTPSKTLSELIEQAKGTLKLIAQDAEVVLQGGPTWHQKYEIKGKEEEFCREILEPLLHKMGFERVRYIHGNDEYGRDFILAEQTRWGWPQYYGIQVKAGDVSGGADSDIDKILGQIEDALAMPYHSQNAEEIFITSFIVAISGHFKKNAKEKIIEKIPRRDWRGSVRFLAQDDIRDLIRQHWLTSFAKR